MCIAVPVEVVAIRGQEAVVNLEAVTKQINIDLVPEVEVGDYVLLHSGCAIKKVDQTAAEETLQVFRAWAEEEGGEE